MSSCWSWRGVPRPRSEIRSSSMWATCAGSLALRTAGSCRSRQCGASATATAPCSFQGEHDVDGRALVLCARDGDPAAVALHDCLGDRQAETGPGNRTLRCGRAAEEALEQALLLRRRDPDACVGHLENRSAVLLEEPHVDPAAARSELEGVRDEV